MRRALLPVVLVVAACGDRADTPTQAQRPAEAGQAPAAVVAPAPPRVPAAPAAGSRAGETAWSQPLDLAGTEPFWAVQIRPSGISFSGPDRPSLTGANQGPAASDGGAVWRLTAGGTPLTIRLRRETCSDGMSDRVYPFAATVTVGDEVLKGCGATSPE